MSFLSFALLRRSEPSTLSNNFTGGRAWLELGIALLMTAWTKDERRKTKDERRKTKDEMYSSPG